MKKLTYEELSKWLQMINLEKSIAAFDKNCKPNSTECQARRVCQAASASNRKSSLEQFVNQLRLSSLLAIRGL